MLQSLGFSHIFLGLRAERYQHEEQDCAQEPHILLDFPVFLSWIVCISYLKAINE